MQADVFYVPVSARLDFALAAAALAKSGLHNEIIMSVLLGMITDVDGKVDIMPVGHSLLSQSLTQLLGITSRRPCTSAVRAYMGGPGKRHTAYVCLPLNA